MPTGDVEIKVTGVEVYSEADQLPIQVFGEGDEPEELRLKYRFLDLRRERIHNNIILRSKVIAEMRKLMIEQGFTEYQTPILTASSPEGARDSHKSWQVLCSSASTATIQAIAYGFRI